jgi:HD-GYP domain-containing protein (c-di-GMP phosphodiesterase class II)
MEFVSLQKPVVWFVSASGAHRGGVMSVLLPLYQVVTFSSPSDALQSGAAKPAVLIADELAPPRDGIGCILLLRESAPLRGVPLLFMSARDDPKLTDKASQAGADWFLLKPYRRTSLVNAVSALANKAIEDGWRRLPDFSRAALQQSIDVFRSFGSATEGRQPLDFLPVMNACGPILDAVAAGQTATILLGLAGHDNYAFAHAMRAAALLGNLGLTIGLPRDRQLVLASSGLLFDIGKLAIPQDILNKQGRLTDGELQIMRSHVDLSVRILSDAGEIPKGILTVAEQHHERLDGSGYPNGLVGKQINELARMAAIADVYCGLTDNRVYKIGFPPEKALSIMAKEMASQLDQQMLALFRSRILNASATVAPVAS